MANRTRYVVIDYLDSHPEERQNSATVAAHFAPIIVGSKMGLDEVFALIIAQLLIQSDYTPEALLHLYADCKKRARKPFPSKLQRIVKDMSLRFKTVYFILDSLDGCSLLYSASLIEFFKQLSCGNGKILWANYLLLPEMESAFTLAISAKNVNLASFVDSRLQADGRLKCGMRQGISEKIVQNSKGSFLLASLHLNRVLWHMTPRKMQKCADTLSTNLDMSIFGVFDGIKAQETRYRELACAVLKWTCH